MKSEEQARILLEALPVETLKGKRDRAILATLMRSRITLPLPKCRGGWGMPTLRPQGCMTAGRVDQRRVPR
jgi:hypothetical protein